MIPRDRDPDRNRIRKAVDRLPSTLVATLIVVTTLGFGGAVWWARPATTAAAILLALSVALRAWQRRSWSLLRSPLGLLGALAMLVAVAQITPLPASLAKRISPHAQQLYSVGALPGASAAVGPEFAAAASRTPASVDRPATLRWLVGAAACLVVFLVVAHDCDRLGRTLTAWGSVLGCFFLFTLFGWVQVLGGAEDHLFGVYPIGKAPGWGPSLVDQWTVPGAIELKTISAPGGSASNWVLPRPIVPDSVAGLMGGPGAFLALAALGLPLGLGLAIHCVAPRGARTTLADRLVRSNRGGIALVVLVLTILSAVLVGVLAGPLLCLPFLLGLLVAALPGARAAGTGWVALGGTALALAGLGAGVALGGVIGRPDGLSPLARIDGWEATRALWLETVRIACDFPLFGSGLGSFPLIHPYYKETYLSSTTAWNSFLRFWSEAGLAGLALLVLAAAWCVVRLPAALRRVGTADRVLAFALVGSVVGFAAFSAMHWTLELPAVSLAACVVAGTLDRWLAGGTDLFVERT